MIVTDSEAFVKRQIHYHERQAYRHRADELKARMHSDYVEQFKSILAALSAARQNPPSELNALIASLRTEIEDLKARPAPSLPSASVSTDPSALTQADLVGLPKELLAQLKLPEQDEQEKLILSIIEESGGTQSLDKLLIAMWRKTQEVPQKKTVTQKLYRMMSKKLLYKVPAKRGLYTTTPMPDSPPDDDEEELP